MPLTDTARFYDKQGRVHGRVSCDFNKEFGIFLSVPLGKPNFATPSARLSKVDGK